MMNNSLNLYHIFYTVALCGNISAAAKKLFISQPAVSKSIARLEESFQTPLLVRTSRGVKLTEAGEILYQQLTTAFHAIQTGEEQIQRNESLGAGRLSIGVSTTLCKYILLPHLQEFLQENPYVKLTITCQSTAQTVVDLENGKLDIGLIGENAVLEHLHFRPVQTITDVFVATEGYLNQLNAKVPASQTSPDEKKVLEQATLLLLDKNNVSRQFIDKYMLLHNIQPEQHIEVSTMDLLIDFAKIGLGIACVIGEFVEKELKEGSLMCFPLKEPVPSRQIGLAYSRNALLTTPMKKLLDKMLP